MVVKIVCIRVVMSSNLPRAIIEEVANAAAPATDSQRLPTDFNIYAVFCPPR